MMAETDAHVWHDPWWVYPLAGRNGRLSSTFCDRYGLSLLRRTMPVVRCLIRARALVAEQDEGEAGEDASG